MEGAVLMSESKEIYEKKEIPADREAPEDRVLVRAEDIHKDYVIKSMADESKKRIHVLKGVSLVINKGEYVSIMGRSGSGKSTFLRILGLISRPTSGDLTFMGKKTSHLWTDEMADLRRRKMGFIYQDFNLMDSLTAMDNIILPGILDKRDESDLKERALELSRSAGLRDELLDKAPYELSGGERQRVAICRALINSPEVLLADEPTGNLDEKSENMVADLLSEINENTGTSIIMVTHNPKLAARSQRLLMIREGRIGEELLREGSENQFYEKILNLM